MLVQMSIKLVMLAAMAVDNARKTLLHGGHLDVCASWYLDQVKDSRQLDMWERARDHWERER